ncbi:MAG: M20/M25/M40 family metallo-hydrolase [Bryobacterales bacterium]|nr:M20/M25/M40 family metallo-hydrolase [Bryobacteraceae bacterium]MDW8354855.1 M20/M25/M40 family metallo-hydrolase [Bryobacterales bacterium]
MARLVDKPAVRVEGLLRETAVAECLRALSRHRQWINEQHIALCRIPAPTFLEQQRAEWMLDQLRALGCEAQLDRAGNVVARPRGYDAGPFVALTAHLDTVLAPRSPEEITVAPDGRFLGPGVSDNGAGLAALLAIAKALQSAPLLPDRRCGLLLVANVGEEGEGNLSGMRYLCRSSPVSADLKALVVLDGPSTDHITCQALESRRFEITITGPGGHSWSDYGVGNPIHALGRAVALLAEHRANGEGPRVSYSFGMIEGGASVNSIPAFARAKVDIRSESARRVEEMAAVLAAAVERAVALENERATGGKVAARVREIGARPGGRLPDDAPLLAYLRAVDAHLGIRSRLDCASTDANIPLSMGIPAVSIGAGGQGGGAHTTAEWYRPEGRDLGLKRILLTLFLLLRDPCDAAG